MLRSLLFLCLALAACATQYQRRMSSADDPANPDAAPTPREVVVTAYDGGSP